MPLSRYHLAAPVATARESDDREEERMRFSDFRAVFAAFDVGEVGSNVGILLLGEQARRIRRRIDCCTRYPPVRVWDACFQPPSPSPCLWFRRDVRRSFTSASRKVSMTERDPTSSSTMWRFRRSGPGNRTNQFPLTGRATARCPDRERLRRQSLAQDGRHRKSVSGFFPVRRATCNACA